MGKTGERVIPRYSSSGGSPDIYRHEVRREARQGREGKINFAYLCISYINNE